MTEFISSVFRIALQFVYSVNENVNNSGSKRSGGGKTPPAATAKRRRNATRGKRSVKAGSEGRPSRDQEAPGNLRHRPPPSLLLGRHLPGRHLPGRHLPG